MKKMLECQKQIMDTVAINVLRISFLCILVVSIFVKAMYSFDDSPYFTTNNFIDVVAFLIVLLVVSIIYKKRKWIQNNMNYKIMAVIFFLCMVTYIVLVPLTPFSDMAAVYRGAINFSEFKWDAFLDDTYWKMFPGNIKLSIFWGILMLPFPKKLLTMKIINGIFVYLIVVFTRELAKEYGVKYYNIVYLFMITFLPLFLYGNHVYFDMPLIFGCVLGLYCEKKYGNIVLTGIILGLTCALRNSAIIFFVAVCIEYVFKVSEDVHLKEKWMKLGIGICVFFILYKVPGKIVDAQFVDGNFQYYSTWNQIYIGINEEEFGFMDNDFSYDRNFQSVVDRIEEYGPKRMLKIFGKKTFWLWSQGTYQAQRYAFGSDVEAATEKFEYGTVLTKYLLKDTQLLRRVLNSFMRAQYLVLFGLMVVVMFQKNQKERYRVLYYIFVATFLVMLIYELKSRYILQLFPIMTIIACSGCDVLNRRHKGIYSHSSMKKEQC